MNGIVSVILLCYQGLSVATGVATTLANHGAALSIQNVAGDSPIKSALFHHSSDVDTLFGLLKSCPQILTHVLEDI